MKPLFFRLHFGYPQDGPGYVFNLPLHPLGPNRIHVMWPLITPSLPWELLRWHGSCNTFSMMWAPKRQGLGCHY